MKKLILLALIVLVFSSIKAQVYKTVDLQTPGELSSNLTPEERSTLTDLTVTGKIDARDLKTIRDSIPNLQFVDLSGSSLMEYTGDNGTRPSWEGVLYYPANVITQYTLSMNFTIVKFILPSNIIEIENYGFSDCAASIELTASVTKLGIAVFKGCTGTVSVNNASTTFIMKDGILFDYSYTQTYYSSSNIQGDIVLPSTLLEVGDYTFYDRTNINSVKFPVGLQRIGSYAFFGCSGISSFVLPASVTLIGAYSFAGTQITGFIFPSHVQMLNYGIFSNCVNLTKVQLPYDVTIIGNDIFYNTPLSKLIATNPIPADLTYSQNAFVDVSLNCVIQVPMGSTDAYKKADVWKNFQNFIEQETITPDFDTLNIDNDAAEITIPFKSNSSWTISNTENWLIPSANSGSMGGNISVQILQNTGADREAILYFDANGNKDSVIIIQKLECAAKLVVSGKTDACKDQLITLTTNATGDVKWFSDVDLKNEINNTSTFNISITTDTTLYAIQSTSAYCTSLPTSHSIGVHQLPTVTANVSKDDVCSLSEVTFYGSGSPVTSYTWNNNVKDNVPTPVYYSTTYTVTGTDANGCSSTATISHKVKPYTSITANASKSEICEGESLTLYGSGAATNFVWDGGVIDNEPFKPTTDTYYTVSGTDANGCITQSGAYIIVRPSPTISISASATKINPGELVTLNGAGGNYYTWSDGIIDGVAFSPALTATYYVTGTNSWNCSEIKDITIFVNTSDKILSLSNGTLSSTLTTSEKNLIENLTLSGTIDARDFKTMRDSMPLLHKIDLQNVSIVAYEGLYGTNMPQIKGTLPDVMQFDENAIPVTALFENTKIDTILLPSTAKVIDSAAFSGCTALNSLPMFGLTKIGDYAFKNCNFKLLDFSMLQAQLGIGVCYGNKNLTFIMLPYNMDSIPDYFASNCTKLSNPSLPISITKIGKYAFESCDSLMSIILPGKLKIIDDFAFNNCSHLSKVQLFANAELSRIGTSSFEACKMLTDIELPLSVTCIGNSSFKDCSGLKKITLPTALYSIGDSAFGNDSALDTIIANNPMPIYLLTQTGIFDNVNTTDCKLIVPFGSKMLYDTASVWKDFSHIVEPILVEKSISVTPGSLYSNIPHDEIKTTEKLIITGSIDARDLKTLRDSLPNLKHVDLTNAQIVEFTGSGGTIDGDMTYPANSIPPLTLFNNKTIKQFDLPLNTQNIQDSAFSNNAASIMITSLVENIGPNAFSDNTGTISLDPSSNYFFFKDGILYDIAVTKTFYSKPNLQGDIVLPSTVIEIGDFSFSNRKGITNIALPATIKQIGYSAFAGTAIKDFVFPSGLQTINSGLFQDCKDLTNVELPLNFSQIGNNVFLNTNIAKLKAPNKTPIDLSANINAFDGINTATCVIQVPMGSTDAYKKADVWKNFQNFVEQDEIIPAVDTIFVDNDQATESIQFSSNSTWNIISEAAWLQAKTTSGSLSGNVEIDITKNIGADRQAFVYFTTTNSFKDSVLIIQKNECSSMPEISGPTEICSGTSAKYTANAKYPTLWYDDASLQNSINTKNSFTTIPLTNTTLYIVQNKTANCSSLPAILSIKVNQLPTINTTVSESNPCYNTKISVNASGDNIISFTWDKSVSNNTPFIITTSQTFTVTGIDVNGCTSTASVAATLKPIPSITTEANKYSICFGDTLILWARGKNMVDYVWDNGVKDSVPFVVGNIENYSVTAIDINGCYTESNIDITVHQKPTISISTNKNDTILVGEDIALIASGGDYYTWDKSVSNGISFTPKYTDYYTVSAFDQFGCTDTLGIKITLLPDYYLLFDNMEDNDQINNLGGQWFTYNDNPGTGTLSPEPPPSQFTMSTGAKKGNYCAQMTYQPGTFDNFGLGSWMQADINKTYDLSKYSNISFYYKGESCEFQILTKDVSDNGWYSVNIPASDKWKLFTIPFSDLKQPILSKQVAFNSKNVIGLQWQLSGSRMESASISVDSVVFNHNINIIDTIKTVSVSAGNLSTSLTKDEMDIISHLTLLGTIDARDFKTMRDSMPNLQIVDLSNAQIIAYSGTEGTGTGNTSYLNNQIPITAFVNKTNLTCVTLPSSTKLIANAAFEYCSNLTSVVYPKELNTIGGEAFYGTGITAFDKYCTVATINSSTFKNCSSLKSVAIAPDVAVVDIDAFANCTGLESIRVYASKIPITTSSSFTGIDKTSCKLYVPVGTVNGYKNAQGWKDFLNIEEFPLAEASQIIGNKFPDQYPVDGINYNLLDMRNFVIDSYSPIEGLLFKVASNPYINTTTSSLGTILPKQIDSSWTGSTIINVTITNLAKQKTIVPIVFIQDSLLRLDNTTKPSCSFIASRQFIKSGESTRFYAQNKNAQSVEWTFERGTPENSNAVSPTVMYDVPGKFFVTLKAINAEGETILTKTGYITVSALSVSDTTICKGDSIIISALGSGYESFSWNTSPVFNTKTIKVSPEKTTTFKISMKKGIATIVDSVTITIAKQPELGNDTTFCEGESMTLSPGSFLSYYWNKSSTPGASTFIANNSGKITIETIDNNGCRAKDSITIGKLYSKPIINLGNDTSFCWKKSLILQAENPGAEYIWNSGEQTQSIIADTTGKYSVTVTDKNSCKNSDTISITVKVPTVPEIGVVTQSTTNKNIIAWEPINDNSIKQYNIWRMNTKGKFEIIKSIYKNDSTYYIDISSTPKIQSYSYALSSVDAECNNESYLSTVHKNMHLTCIMQKDGTVEVKWDNYVGLPVSSYDIYRAEKGKKLEKYISVDPEKGSTTTYIDNNAIGLNSYYQISFELAEDVISSKLKSDSGPYSQSLSNLAESELANISQINDISIYPNPSNNIFTINGIEHATIEVLDMNQQLILKANLETKKQFDCNSWSNGIYFILISTKDGVLIKKTLSVLK